MADVLNGDAELKSEIEYNLRRMEVEEEERKHVEALAETTESNENKNDENRNLDVLTTSPEEICEQLQNLIVQLSRCDSIVNNNNREMEESVHPVVKLTKCDNFLQTGAEQEGTVLTVGDKNGCHLTDFLHTNKKGIMVMILVSLNTYISNHYTHFFNNIKFS